MIQCERQGCERAPGVANDDGTAHAERFDCFSQQIGLPLRRPHRAERLVAIPEPRAVKRDDPTLSPSPEIEQPAQTMILHST